MTAAALKILLDSLPNRVVKKILKLSRERNETVASIVEQAVALYEKRTKSKVMKGEDRLARLMKDPKKREVFEELTVAMAERANAGMSSRQRTARAVAGAKGRNASLTPERRAEIARRAGQISQQKKREKEDAAGKG